VTKNAQAYLELLKVNEEMSWPERYVRDLFVLDCQILGQFPEHEDYELPEGMPFGWILRDSGTFLIYPDRALDDCGASYYVKEIDNWTKSYRHRVLHRIAYEMWGENERGCQAASYLYFWWDGDTLMRVPSPRTIIDRMRAWQDENRRVS
jgi:hypothetical protein